MPSRAVRLAVLVLLPACSRASPPPPPADPAPPPAAASPVDPAGRMGRLARTDPVAFLDECLARYRAAVRGYACELHKHEVVGGRLRPAEVIDVAFRESPFAVRMKWTAGAGVAEATLYVEGENDGKLLARPAGAVARAVVGDVLVRDPLGPDAKAASRYPLPEFGMGKGLERTRAAWAAARAAGRLKVECDGVVPVEELGGRPCLVLRRTCDPPEEDGLTDLWTAFDADTWLQTGSRLEAGDGRLIGEYYFRDVRLNPDFPPDQFSPAALAR